MKVKVARKLKKKNCETQKAKKVKTKKCSEIDEIVIQLENVEIFLRLLLTSIFLSVKNRHTRVLYVYQRSQSLVFYEIRTKSTKQQLEKFVSIRTVGSNHRWRFKMTI